MTCEASYLELAGAFRRILRDTTRFDEALRVFDAQRLRMLALRDLVVDEIVRVVAVAFASTPLVLLSAPPGSRDLADARALLAHVLGGRGWTADRIAELLGEDITAVRAMEDAVMQRPSLMIIARLALEAASSRSDISPEPSVVPDRPSNPVPVSVTEPDDGVFPCRHG